MGGRQGVLHDAFLFHHHGFGPFVVPGIARGAQCTEGIKRYRPAQAAEQSGESADATTLFGNGHRTGDQFAEGPAPEHGFYQSHIHTIEQQPYQPAEKIKTLILSIQQYGQVEADLYYHIAEEVHEYIEHYEVDNIITEAFA